MRPVRVSTRSGSRYEVDPAHCRIRRLTGTHDPTPRQGPDGRWKHYVELGGPIEGVPMSIVWDVEVVDGRTRERGTVTSAVEEVGEAG